MGRKPNSKAIKVLTGNPGRLGINKREPKLPIVKSPPPEWMNEEAARFYEKLSTIMVRAGMMAETDETVLTMLAVSWANMRQAQKMLEKTGPVIKTPNGSLQTSPFKTQERQAIVDIIRCCAELGLSPTARTKVMAIGTGEVSDDPFDDL